MTLAEQLSELMTKHGSVKFFSSLVDGMGIFVAQEGWENEPCINQLADDIGSLAHNAWGDEYTNATEE